MKKLMYILAVSATTFAFQACNNENKDATETADSLNMSKDTTSNVMETGGIAVDQADAEFATKAAAGGMAEVELGNLALTKTSHAKLKEFANMMVNDHSKVNEELKTIAKMKNITLPGMVDEDHQKKINELKTKTGADFDKAYTEAMVDGHKKTLDLMNAEAKDGKDPELKAFAAKTAPAVQTHLDLITTIQKSLK